MRAEFWTEKKPIYVHNVCKLYIIAFSVMYTNVHTMESQTLDFSCAASTERLPCLILNSSEVPFPISKAGIFV